MGCPAPPGRARSKDNCTFRILRGRAENWLKLQEKILETKTKTISFSSFND